MRPLLPSSRPLHARGFTLIEVLLATVLLAAGMALAFAAVRSTLAISSRGEAIASGNERMRAVEGFLRRRLVSAMPLALERDALNGNAAVFTGSPKQLRFVANVPDYLGRGGPYLHTLEVSGSGEAQELRLGLTLLQSGQLLEENPPRGSELLADRLKQVKLRYRGIEPGTTAMGRWQDSWDVPGRMPMLVSIEVTPAQGAAWPPLVVALPQSSVAGSWR
ncbi:prepilin-type N-terminal cleavage/methylation domain-containing protein [Stenotrophomonas pigmentata]|uniref:prepilin-type N-terminal cleavage/methylation domain-containing protein n=1 Tax=Stenotrophomonas pigmentata TaxID=3055080 RepID=UPI0026ED334F|nr:prepilin-type N-terminal cleavage/methylation domain-containing protein [Stenotrophomonas sp. 610A2]